MLARPFALLSLLVGAATATLPNFVGTSGEEFTLDGKSYYFAGTNAYWFQFLSNFSDVEVAMTKAVGAGLHVIRTWGFNDKNVTFIPGGLPNYSEDYGPIWFQEWANGKATYNFGPDGFGRFDQLVALAEQKDVKLVVALTNNWADYGGMDVYTINLGGQYHDDFYTVPKIIQAYKNYINVVVSRYRDSPAIFSWELANEPRCEGTTGRNLPRSPNCTCATVTNWVKEISEYIKELDPNHLVTTGIEGFFNYPGNPDWPYGGGDGVDFNATTAIKTIDYNTFHLYPDSWSETVLWGVQWVKAHAEVQRALHKPVVMEEYGFLSAAARLAQDGTVSNYTRVQAEGSWQQTSVEERLAGDQFWQLGVEGLSFGNSTDDGFTIYIETPEAKVLVYEHVAAVNALNY